MIKNILAGTGVALILIVSFAGIWGKYKQTEFEQLKSVAKEQKILEIPVMCVSSVGARMITLQPEKGNGIILDEHGAHYQDNQAWFTVRPGDMCFRMDAGDVIKEDEPTTPSLSVDNNDSK